MKDVKSDLVILDKKVVDVKRGDKEVRRIFYNGELVYTNFESYPFYMIYTGDKSFLMGDILVSKGTEVYGDVKMISNKEEDYVKYDYDNWEVLKFDNLHMDKAEDESDLVTDFNFALTNLPPKTNLKHFKTDNATTFFQFAVESHITIMDLNHLVTDNVTFMADVFSHSLMTHLYIDKWNTSKVTTMEQMFYDCVNLQELDLSTWNTGKVNTMTGMFRQCYSLEKLNVPFDTSYVTSFANMFLDCEKLEKLDLTSWNTERVTMMQGMFQNCESIRYLDLSNFHTPKLTRCANMFSGCTSLRFVDLSNFDTRHVRIEANSQYSLATMFSGVTDCVVCIGENWTLSTDGNAFGGSNLIFVRV